MTACDGEEDAYFKKVLKFALLHGRREKRREMVYIHDRGWAVFGLKGGKAAGNIREPKAMEYLQIMMHQSFMERGEVALAVDEMGHPNRDKLLNQLLNNINPTWQTVPKLT